MLEKYRQQLSHVDKILPTQMLGIFHLKLHLLKNVAKPTCESLLVLVEKTIVKYVFWGNIVNEIITYVYLYCTCIFIE